MKELPIYRLLIDEDNDTGVEFVAFVDRPAIQRNWVAFQEHKKDQQFKIQDEEKRIVSGALMLADLPIYRNDKEMGEYYAVFEKDTIEQIMQRYAKNGFHANVNLMHDSKSKVDGVYMIESWLIDSEKGKKAPEGFTGITDGSWFGSFKVENDNVWNEFIKTGELNGFSIEGVFVHEKQAEQDEDIIQGIIETISKITE